MNNKKVFNLNLIISILLLTLSSCKKHEARGSSSLDVKICILDNGSAEIEETILINHEKRGPFTRQMPLYEDTGSFMFPQRIYNVSVHDSDKNGRVLKSRLRRGDFWTNIDILELPEDNRPVSLSYSILAPFKFSDKKALFRWNFPGSFWPYKVISLKISFTLPEKVNPGNIKISALPGYSNKIPGQLITENNTVIWTSTKAFSADQCPLEFSLILPSEHINRSGGTSFFKEITSVSALPVISLILFLITGIILKFLRPDSAVSALKKIQILFIPGILTSLLPLSLYWIHETGYRSGDLSDAVSTILFTLFAMTYISIYIGIQYKNLTKWELSAYYNQFALPVVLAVVIIVPAPGISIWIISGLFIYLFWPGREIAFQFGAGIEKIVAEVQNRGETSFKDLAKALSLKEKQLENILKNFRSLPIVTDFKNRKVLSPEIVSMKKTYKICPACSGGIPSVQGQALLRCEYCGLAFYSGKQGFKPERPVPLIIKSLSAFLRLTGFSLFVFSGITVLLFSLLEIMSGAGISSLILVSLGTGLIIASAGYFFTSLSVRIVQGEWCNILKALLLAASPLIIPLFVLKRLKAMSVQFLFKRISAKILKQDINQKGEISISDLSDLWGCAYSEAAELAAYLTAHNIIDAVYDRNRASLVSRVLYRQLASENRCSLCGGILGITDGRVCCQFCGSS